MAPAGDEQEKAASPTQVDDDEFSLEVKKLLTYPEKARNAYNEIAARTLEVVDAFVVGARSLLIAHGAAAFAAIQMLQGAEGARLRLVSAFAGAFCLGFFFACLSTFFGGYARSSAATRYWEVKNRYSWSDSLLMMMSFVLSFLILSGATLILAWLLLRVAFGYDDDGVWLGVSHSV